MNDFLNHTVWPEPQDQITVTVMEKSQRIHSTAVVESSVVGNYIDIGPCWTVLESSIGDYSYLSGSDGVVQYTAIGNFCSIASHVVINPGDHPMERVTQHHCTYRRRRYGFDTQEDMSVFEWRRNHACHIGHDVWIGNGAKIMSGVTIGIGAVIGSGSVVTHDVRPYQIVVGVPARPLRMRFTAEVVEKLLAIAWWNWDRKTLESRFHDLMDLNTFLDKYA